MGLRGCPARQCWRWVCSLGQSVVPFGGALPPACPWPAVPSGEGAVLVPTWSPLSPRAVEMVKPSPGRSGQGLGPPDARHACCPPSSVTVLTTTTTTTPPPANPVRREKPGGEFSPGAVSTPGRSSLGGQVATQERAGGGDEGVWQNSQPGKGAQLWAGVPWGSQRVGPSWAGSCWPSALLTAPPTHPPSPPPPPGQGPDV